MDPGTCADYKILWYYNKIDKECSRFYYGGKIVLQLINKIYL